MVIESFNEKKTLYLFNNMDLDKVLLVHYFRLHGECGNEYMVEASETWVWIE